VTDPECNLHAHRFNADVGSEPVTLSVITPVYNAQSTIARTLRSLDVIAEDRRNGVEVLVVDDGSTDNSAGIITRWLDNHTFNDARLMRKDNGGTATARNQGLQAARGAWLLLLDADDELIANPLPFIDANPNATALCFSAVMCKRGKHVRHKRPPRIDTRNPMNTWTAGNPLQPSTVVLRRDAISTEFNASFHIVEDWEFWMANPEIFRQVVRCPSVALTNIHAHGRNKSSDQRRCGKDRQLLADHVLSNVGNVLTPFQANNLRLQRQIGVIQEGGRLSLRNVAHWPCSVTLWCKMLIYALLRDHVKRFDVYGPPADDESQTRRPT